MSLNDDPDFGGPVQALGDNEPPSLPMLTPNVAAFDANGNLPELSALGTVLGILSATDPEAEAVSFSSDNSAFSVVKNLAGAFELQVADSAKLNFEAGGTISVKITASTETGPSSESIITFVLADVDEAPAELTLALNEAAFDGGKLAEFSPSTMSPPIGLVLGTLSAVDPETKPVTFTVDNAAFSVVENNGAFELQVADPSKFDFEADNGEISVTVTAATADGPSSSKTFTFGLADVDEAPIGVSFTDFVTSITENVDVGAGIFIATLGIVDQDAGASTSFLDLIGEDEASFEIREEGGVSKLYFKGKPGLRGEAAL